MKINELAPAPGAKSRRKRVGRGPGGTDKTSGRGHKGQQSRSGAGKGRFFEGGRSTLISRLPKRGFNHVGQEFHLVNLADLERFEAGSRVDGAALVASRLIKKERHPIKLLGRGDLSVALDVTVHAASEAAIEKVRAAGGSVTLLGVGRQAAEAPSIPGAGPSPIPDAGVA